MRACSVGRGSLSWRRVVVLSGLWGLSLSPLAAAAQAVIEPAAAAASAPLLEPAAPAASSVAAALPAAPVPARWAWRLAGPDRPEFKGGIDRDRTGSGPGAMMYPAPNLVGFLVAIATHAAINETAKSARETELQNSADVRMLPYRPVTDALSSADLQRAALQHPAADRLGIVAHPGDSAPAGAGPDAVVVTTQHSFVLSPDQKSLMLDAAVVLGTPAPGAAAGAPQKTIRVISAPMDAAEPARHWLDADGQRMKGAAVALLAEMIRIAVSEQPPDAELPQKTVRFMSGDSEKVERGYLLSQRCGRVLMRNLRGWLLSVPQTPADRGGAKEADQAACPVEPGLRAEVVALPG